MLQVIMIFNAKRKTKHCLMRENLDEGKQRAVIGCHTFQQGITKPAGVCANMRCTPGAAQSIRPSFLEVDLKFKSPKAPLFSRCCTKRLSSRLLPQPWWSATGLTKGSWTLSPQRLFKVSVI